MTDLAGYFAAVPTPFTPDGSGIADSSLADLVARNLGAGLHGLYVGGSTGEAFLMTETERERVLRVAAEAANGGGHLIAHVGDPDPAVSGRLARAAAAMGYDAISAVPPFYYQYGMDEIREHYAWLAGQADLPFIVYNFPALSGVRWTVDELSDLLDLPGVIGVKNTCPDLYAFEKLRRRAPDSILYHGFDETLLAGLSVGADGGIGSTYNIQPARILALADAHHAGRTHEARSLQAEANTLIDALVAVGVLPGLKYLLGRSGIPMGDCRRPFRPLSDVARRRLDQVAERNLDAVPAGQRAGNTGG